VALEEIAESAKLALAKAIIINRGINRALTSLDIEDFPYTLASATMIGEALGRNVVLRSFMSSGKIGNDNLIAFCGGFLETMH
jgi:hypothetical protein